MSKLSSLLYVVSNKFKKKVVIPSYHEKRAILLSYKESHNLSVMVETGTFFGDTVDFFKDKLDQVYSIELSEELAAKAKKRFEGQANVQILQGDSGEVLKSLTKEISSPTLYWLDGHYSSEFYVGEEFIKTARSEKDTPIMKELETLLNDSWKHVILIDDARCFNGKGDYPALRTIRQVVEKSKHSFDVFVEKDIIHIIPVK